MRLFVAVRPPPPVCDILLAAMGGVTGARWQADDQLHLTLRFIGEVDRHAAADIAAALAGVRHLAIDAVTGGVGSFADRGRPNALWVGVGPAAALAALHLKVDQALFRAGIARDGRAFHPHVTLARLGRGAGSIAGFLSAPAVTTSFVITRFTLFESVLTRERAEYRALETYDFARPAER